jgi:hypothetical protein
MNEHRIVALVLLAAALTGPAGGCGIGTYNPPPGGARSAPPAKAPAPDAPRAFVFSQPVKPAPVAVAAPAPVTPSSDPVLPVGRACRVHFKPIEATAGTAAPAMSPVEGVLEQANGEWLVVKGTQQTYWVPRGAVLRVDVANGS